MSEQRKRRGGWSNPASATNGKAGGRIRTRYTLSRPAAIYLRALAQSRHQRRDVTEAELDALLEEIVTDYARRDEMQTQIWQHTSSGERYAVGVDNTGRVVGAAGPLHHSEIPAALAGDWDTDADVTEDLAADSERYRNVTEQAKREG